MERYMSSTEAAPVLGVTVQTVYLLAKRGELPVAATTEGGRFLFRRDAVEKVAAERAERRKPTGTLALSPDLLGAGR